MCSSSSNGINVIWRMEVFENLDKNDNICAKINWPLSDIVFIFKVRGTDDEDDDDNYSSDDSDGVNKDNGWLTIKRIDKSEEKITLNGTVSIISSAGSNQDSDEFSSVNFKCNVSRQLRLKSFRSMLPKGTITLLIQLWNSSQKQINSNYYAFSKINREKCNFEWKLDTRRMKDKCRTGGHYCHNYFRTVPRKFTIYNKIIKQEINIELVAESFSQAKEIYCVFIRSEAHLKGKLKIVAISYNGNTLDLMDTYFFTNISGSLNFHFQELIANRRLFYHHGNLTLNVFIETLSYLNAEITEVDCLSDTQNIGALIERSKKFRKDFNEEKFSSETLSTSLYALYKESHFCDVTLCVGKEKFSCHKSVLCARSPVFRAMFDNNMQEKESNMVQIQDMDTRSFGIFLNILYTDSLLNVEREDVLKVYEAADKYDVLEIRNMCSKHLLSTLSKTNVCQMLELSNAHQDNDLMKKVKVFFCKHAKDVMKLPEWNDFMLRNLLFAAKLMQEIISP